MSHPQSPANSPEPPRPSPLPDTATDTNTRIRLALQAALWGALLGGWGEYSLRFGLRAASSALDSRMYLHPQAFWMAPMANIPIFAVALTCAALLVRDRRRFAWVILFLALFLAALEVGLITRRIHVGAIVLIAAGIATQAARILAPRERLATMIVRRSTAAMAAASILGGVAWQGWDRTRSQPSAALARSAEQAPNVLLILLDTVRESELGLYGYARNTSPTIDSLARDGITFTRAFTVAPWTLPSHASLFTGRYPQELSTGWHSALDDAFPTLAEHYAAAGYATGGFVGNLFYTSRETGLGRGFERYVDHPMTIGAAFGTTTLVRAIMSVLDREIGVEVDPGRKDAAQVNREFLAWQASQPGRPFFAFLNYFDAHAPYEVPLPFDTLFLGRSPRHRSLYQLVQRDSSTVRELRAAYDGAIRSMDNAMNELFSELKRRGVLEHTLVIITSDHGEEFGEHGHMGHGTSLYLTQLHVPLIVLLPGRSVRGARVDEPVTLADVAATVETVAPVSPTRRFPGQPFSGTSIIPRNDPANPSRVYAEVRYDDKLPPWYPLSQGDMSAILMDGWHLIAHRDGREELFQVDIDPLEQRNLVGDPSAQIRLRELRAELAAARRERRSPM